MAVEDDWRTPWILGRRLLLLLVPVVVGGLFSIAPTVYQAITAPTSVLTYTRTAGPAINTASGYREISAVTVRNAGKTPLTGVEVDLNSRDGQIESSAIDHPLGVSAKEERSLKNYHLNVERLLPGDGLSASVMILASAPSSPDLSVRSNEVRGTELPDAEANTTKINKNDLLTVLLGMLGTFFALTGLAALLFLQRRGTSLPSFLRAGNREEMITFILALSNVIPLDVKTFYKQSLSYIRTGDLLLATALRGDDGVKERCVLALKALLVANRDMNPSSANAIRDNLKRLGVTYDDTAYEKLRIEAAAPAVDLMEARRRVAEVFSAKNCLPGQ
jgi:hypothetical protein